MQQTNASRFSYQTRFVFFLPLVLAALAGFRCVCIGGSLCHSIESILWTNYITDKKNKNENASAFIHVDM